MAPALTWRSGRTSSRATALLVVLLVAITGAAHAEPSAAELATARRLFREATELREASQWSAAAVKLREALAIKETPGLRFHLAHCEEKLLQFVDALSDYERADELIRAGARAPDVESLLGPARASLAARTPTIQVRVASDIPGVTVTIDGMDARAALAEGGARVNPGVHAVSVEAEDRAPLVVEVSLAEGDARVIDADLQEIAAAKPAPPTRAHPIPAASGAERRPEKRANTREFLLIAEGAVTLVGLGVGTYFLVERADAGDRYREADADPAFDQDPEYMACASTAASPPAACAELAEARDDRKKAETYALVGFVGAGVGALSFAGTFFLWPRATSRDDAPSARLVPFPGGAAVVGAF